MEGLVGDDRNQLLHGGAQRQPELQQAPAFVGPGVDLLAQAGPEDLVLGLEELDLADQLGVDQAQQEEE